jgi:type IX secretion system PorP/SprF family membrane protein
MLNFMKRFRFNYFWIFVVWVFHAAINLNAQDLHFSQFESSPLNLNPALTGDFDGNFRIIGNHRNQWQSITEPFKSYSVSADALLTNFMSENRSVGLGLLLNTDKAGDSEFGMTQVGFQIAYREKLPGNSKTEVSFGIQTSFNQKNLNYNNLRFNSQYDGIKFDPNLPSNQQFANDKIKYWDLAIGINLHHTVNRKIKIYGGLASFHLSKPDQSFTQKERIPLDKRTNIHAGAEISIQQALIIYPSLLYMKQGKFKELNLGGNVKFKLQNTIIPAVYVGSWYRMKDAFFVKLGFDYKNLNLGMSYDFNTSKLKTASNSRGGFELSAIYIFKRPKPIAPVMKCFDFI